MSDNSDPFLCKTDGPYKGMEDPTVNGRIDKAKTFTVEQCDAALAMPHLQSTVRKSVERRKRKLEKEAKQEPLSFSIKVTETGFGKCDIVYTFHPDMDTVAESSTLSTAFECWDNAVKALRPKKCQSNKAVRHGH